MKFRVTLVESPSDFMNIMWIKNDFQPNNFSIYLECSLCLDVPSLPPANENPHMGRGEDVILHRYLECSKPKKDL